VSGGQGASPQRIEALRAGLHAWPECLRQPGAQEHDRVTRVAATSVARARAVVHDLQVDLAGARLADRQRAQARDGGVGGVDSMRPGPAIASTYVAG